MQAALHVPALFLFVMHLQFLNIMIALTCSFGMSQAGMVREEFVVQVLIGDWNEDQ